MQTLQCFNLSIGQAPESGRRTRESCSIPFSVLPSSQTLTVQPHTCRSLRRGQINPNEPKTHSTEKVQTGARTHDLSMSRATPYPLDHRDAYALRGTLEKAHIRARFFPNLLLCFDLPECFSSVSPHAGGLCPRRPLSPHALRAAPRAPPFARPVTAVRPCLCWRCASSVGSRSASPLFRTAFNNYYCQITFTRFWRVFESPFRPSAWVGSAQW